MNSIYSHSNQDDMDARLKSKTAKIYESVQRAELDLMQRKILVDQQLLEDVQHSYPRDDLDTIMSIFEQEQILDPSVLFQKVFTQFLRNQNPDHPLVRDVEDEAYERMSTTLEQIPAGLYRTLILDLVLELCNDQGLEFTYMALLAKFK